MRVVGKSGALANTGDDIGGCSEIETEAQRHTEQVFKNGRR